MMKWIFGIIIIFFGSVMFLTLFLQPNDFLGCHDQPLEGSVECHKADAIVVVSGGDTFARTDAGIRLYQNGWADALVLSGAALDKSGPSNAAAMKTQALAQGVPESAIFIDEESETTQQNAEKTKSIFAAQDFANVILVTSGYHQRRASLEFENQDQGISIRNYPVVNDGDWGWWWWLTPWGWWLAGTELVKIIIFYVGAAV